MSGTNSMTVCSEAHDPVVYDGFECPACALKRELREADSELSKALAMQARLSAELGVLQEELHQREGMIAQLRKGAL